jgi:endo-beta-N-acetylglucosaminidase D
MKDNPQIIEFAGELYNKYCESVGWKAYNDTDLPKWEEFRNNPEKKKQSDGWVSLAKYLSDKYKINLRHLNKFSSMGSVSNFASLEERDGEINSPQE